MNRCEICGAEHTKKTKTVFGVAWLCSRCAFFLASKEEKKLEVEKRINGKEVDLIFRGFVA